MLDGQLLSTTVNCIKHHTAQKKESALERKTLQATTSVVDQEAGEFEALVSAWDSDRENDVISLTAFDKTITAWRASGKNLPLLFEHGTEVVGHIDPATMRATRHGLVAEGQIDRESPRGGQAWKMVKSGTAGFSVGFMSKSEPRPNGGRRLTEVDLLEVSITSTPMHPSTRALSWKSAGTGDLDAEFAGIKASFDVDRYREKEAEPATKSTGPIRVATFDC